LITEFFHALRNAYDFPLRQFFRWRREGLTIENQPKNHSFDTLTEENRRIAEAESARLEHDYHLHYLYEHSTLDNYLENLYYLSLLEQAFASLQSNLPDSILAADIGVSHWFYVQALAAFYKWFKSSSKPRAIHLYGYETDAYRVYANLYARYDFARVHMQGLEEVEFFPKKFSPLRERYDVITLFFPFIFLKDHLTWGLPHTHFSPDSLLQEAWTSLKHGGTLLIVNQGKEEFEKQTELLARRSIPATSSFLFQSIFYRYDTERYVTVVTRE
jgi:SAM-dependent methyltransferase